MKKSFRVTWLAIILTTAVWAANEKLSPDLQSGLQSKRAEENVEVIVQYKVPPTEAHHQRVAAMGGRLHSRFNSIKGAHYSIPASQIEKLANDPDVVHTMAGLVGLVQVLWRPARRPMAAQVMFNPACLALSASFAWLLSRFVLDPWLSHSVIGLLVVSTLVLYGSNTVIVAAMMALVERKPLSGIWKICYFWSLPYYLVGAAAAGIMTAVTRTSDWPPSLLVLPLMVLVYVSYRVQLGRAVSTPAALAR